MNKPITVVKVVKTCESCPSQWEAVTEDRRLMYVRYRWGRLTIQLGEPGNWLLERTILGGEMIYSEQLGDDLHGWMSYEELVQHTSGVISWPAAETAWESTDWAWREIRGRGMAW